MPSPASPARRSWLTAACLAALLPACTLAAPPSALLSGYGFTGQGSADFANAGSPDTDVRGYGLSFEFLPIPPNANLAVSLMFRDDEVQPGSARTISSNVVRVQTRWHHDLGGGLTWYLAPGIGVAFGADDDLGGEYDDGSWYYDFEVGGRLWLGESLGLTAVANQSWLNLDGSNGTAGVDLTATTLWFGAFVNL